MSHKEDVLSSLKPYFEDDFDENDEEKLDVLFNRFKIDFFETEFLIDCIKVKCKIHPYLNSEKDNLPRFFSNYYEKFVHIITRKIDQNTKKRFFESKRANRIHWIKPIIENWDSKLICAFKVSKDGKTERYHFWLPLKSYIVIFESINEELILITGFDVDENNENYYRHLFEKSEEIKKPHLR